MNANDKTPLERARERQGKQANPFCNTCKNHVVVDDVDFCEISGKLLLPSFLDVSICLGKDYRKGEPT